MTKVEPEDVSPSPVTIAPKRRGRVVRALRAFVLSPVSLGRLCRNRLWGSAEKARLRGADLLPGLSPRQRADLGQAFAVRRLTGEAMSSSNGQRAAAILPAVIGMVRNGTFWALSASTPDPAPADIVEAFERFPADTLAQLIPDEAVRERLRTTLTVSSESWGRRPRDEQEQGLADLTAFSTAILRRLTFVAQRLRAILIRRLVISFVTLIVVVGGVKAGLSFDWRPSLTAGQPWRTSSTLEVCRPHDHYCADAVTDILFHTVEEENPWVEFDLGTRRPFRRLVVKNRSDCCPDRAVPLALEVSDDRLTWREITRKTETFSKWKADFPVTRAQYIRLRAMRRTLLHLESVNLYR